MVKNNISVKDAKVLLLGITFKENCPDIRNTKAIDVYNALSNFNMNVDVYDPWADKNQVKKEFGIDLIEKPKNTYDVIVHVVAHNQFLDFDLSKFKKENSIVYDVKGNLPKDKTNGRL